MLSWEDLQSYILLQSNSTRAADLESHIQKRVNDELKRLDAKADESLKELENKLSTADTNDALANKEPGAQDQAFRFEDSKTRDLSRAKVQEQIDELKEKLKGRQLRDDVAKDKAVEKAKSDVVSCLRLNDRRPLDCWQEVETFKKEVSRLEKRFLGRVLES